jgi:hypothetical protein
MNGAFVIKAIVKDTPQNSGPTREVLDLDGYYRYENRQQEHRITSVARICETEQRGVEGGAVRLRQSLNIAVSMELLNLSRVVDVPHYPHKWAKRCCVLTEAISIVNRQSSDLHSALFLGRRYDLLFD